MPATCRLPVRRRRPRMNAPSSYTGWSVVRLNKFLLMLVVALGGAACSDPAPPACVANLSTNCMGLFDPPTFQALYDNVLHPTCASGSGTCHTTDGAKAG